MTQWYYLSKRKIVTYGCDILTDPKKWAKLNNKNFGGYGRFIRKTYVDKVFISTVFLGLDHNYSGGEPLLFETMIFGKDDDEYQTRCSTHREALKMHWKAVNLIKGA